MPSVAALLAKARPFINWLPVLAWAGLIFWLSSRPALPAPHIPYVDKVEHGVFYAALAWLLARAWFPSRRLRRRRASVRWGLVVLACLFYGISDEAHQAFVPGRSCDPADAAADAAGPALLAVVASKMRLRP